VDFSAASNPNGPWDYGYGVAGSTFNLFTVADPGPPFERWTVPDPVLGTPAVVENTTGSPIVVGTVLIPEHALAFHPGPSVDTMVRWTAPAAGDYSYSGYFDLLDILPSGIVGEVFANSQQLFSGELTGPGADPAADAPGGREFFQGTVSLQAGDTLTFAVNNDGTFLFDTTGLGATITTGDVPPPLPVLPAVPEPRAWAMIVAGFGGIGVAARAARRRRRPFATT
jgi:hypothetical protein